MLIGGTCKHSNVFSGPVLIARGLDLEHTSTCYGVLRVSARSAQLRLTAWAVIATGKHLFPFRTEKLSPLAPMVLGEQSPGRVGRRPPSSRKAPAQGAFRRSAPALPHADGDADLDGIAAPDAGA